MKSSPNINSKKRWNNIKKKFPLQCREVEVKCSDGTISTAHAIKNGREFMGWVFDLFAQPAKDASVVKWRYTEDKKDEI